MSNFGFVGVKTYGLYVPFSTKLHYSEWKGMTTIA